jgi:hypothetical protein
MASRMPCERRAVEKLDGYLLRGLRALHAATLALEGEAPLYGIHTSAICEFEAWGQRLRDRRVGWGPQKRGSGEAGGRVGRVGVSTRASSRAERGIGWVYVGIEISNGRRMGRSLTAFGMTILSETVSDKCRRKRRG